MGSIGTGVVGSLGEGRGSFVVGGGREQFGGSEGWISVAPACTRTLFHLFKPTPTYTSYIAWSRSKETHKPPESLHRGRQKPTFLTSGRPLGPLRHHHHWIQTMHHQHWYQGWGGTGLGPKANYPQTAPTCKTNCSFFWAKSRFNNLF